MDRDAGFNNLCLEFSVYNSICKNMIDCCSGFHGDAPVALFIVGIIPKLNIKLTNFGGLSCLYKNLVN